MIAVVQLPAAAAPETASPGLAGFLAMFALALATVVLIRSMVKHLRKVRYGPGPTDSSADSADASPEPPAAPTER